MIICETPSETRYSFNSDPLMEKLSSNLQELISIDSSSKSKKSTENRQNMNSIPEVGPMEFRKMLFEKDNFQELTWFISGTGLRRKDFMKEQNIVSNQDKGKLSYILNSS